jgi:CBS domain-containing protein
MRCSSCGHENIAGVDLCDACHAPLSEVFETADLDAAMDHNLRTEPIRALSPARPFTVSPNDKVRDVIALIVKKKIGCALVVWCDTLVGIFTERDVLMKIGCDIDKVADSPVRHFMTPAPESLTELDSIAFALNRMAVGDFRHIPIEEDERPVGVISVRDVLQYLTDHYPELLTQSN